MNQMNLVAYRAWRRDLPHSRKDELDGALVKDAVR
jgi:hypothetical protein